MRFSSLFITAGVFSFLTLLVPTSYAAQSINLREQNPTILTSPQSLYALPSAAEVQDSPEIQEVSKEIDAQGNTHIHARQTYLGYLVWGAEKLIHISSTGKKTENGIIFQGLGADLQGTSSYVFSKAQADLAIQKAIESYAKKSAKIQVPLRQQSQLMVYVDDTKKAHWVFQVELYIKSDNTAPTNPFYLMDAMTFEIYKEWNGMQFFDVVKAGGFGGNPKIGMVTYDGSPNNKPMLDIRRDSATGTCYLQNDYAIVKDGRSVDYENDPDGKNASVMSFKCDQVDPTHGSIYWDGALDQVNGAWSPANDALYLAGKVNSMYEDWYSIPVIHDSQDSNKPMMINMLVHDRTFKFGWDGLYWGGSNAVWNGATQTMQLGDGIELFGDIMDDSYPFVVPDIIAHELSHGFSQQHANFWGWGIPGGINESFSDMASKAFEYYTTRQNNWMQGVDTRKDNKAIRYLDEPTKDCQEGRGDCSIDNAKNYTIDMDVHFSAGVFNKAFYLLSISPGWNTRKAFDMMVQANRYHWTSIYLDFPEAACGVWDAANDLSYSKADLAIITNAMNRVGLEARETKCHPWSFSSIWSWITGDSTG